MYVMYIFFQFHYVDVDSSALFDTVLVKCSLLATFPQCSINLILVVLNTRHFPVQDAGLISSVETVLN
jgi:hypothetical protein